MKWAWAALGVGGLAALLWFEWASTGRKLKKERLRKAAELLQRVDSTNDPQLQVAILQEVRKIYEQYLPADHLHLVDVLEPLAHLFLIPGHFQESVALFERSLQIKEKHLGPNHAKVGDTLLMLAGLQKSEEAIGYATRCISIFERNPADRNKLCLAYRTTSQVYADRGDYATAIDYIKKAEKLHNEMILNAESADSALTVSASSISGVGIGGGKRIGGLIETRLVLAKLYQKQKNYEEAERVYSELMELIRSELGRDDIILVTVQQRLAAMYVDKGDTAAAESTLKAAAEFAQRIVRGMASAQPAVDATMRAFDVKNQLAQFYVDIGRDGDAAALYTEMRSLKCHHTNTASRYLQTKRIEMRLAVRENAVIYAWELEPTAALPRGACLVFRFENPAGTNGGADTGYISHEYTLKEEEHSAPIIVISKGVSEVKRSELYEASVEIFSDASKTQRLGMHRQLCQAQLSWAKGDRVQPESAPQINLAAIRQLLEMTSPITEQGL